MSSLVKATDVLKEESLHEEGAMGPWEKILVKVTKEKGVDREIVGEFYERFIESVSDDPREFVNDYFRDLAKKDPKYLEGLISTYIDEQVIGREED